MAYTKNELKTGNTIEQKHTDNIDNTLDAHDKAITALEGKTKDATTGAKGIVKMAAKVDAVGTADPTAMGDSYVKADVQKIADLAKANKTAINAILTALKNAGSMSNS